MKTAVILGITLAAGAGIVALAMPGSRTFADLRNLTLPATWTTATPASTLVAATPMRPTPIANVPPPVHVTRLASIEQAAHAEAERRRAILADEQRDQDLAAQSALLTREHMRTRAFLKVMAAEDIANAAFDTKYFKGSEFSGCAKACNATAPCVAPTGTLPKSPRRPAAALHLMEAERETLEQIRETIEDDHSDGRLTLDHYKRLMTRYVCGIRTYQARITSSLSIADAD
jgi:hypothetical protein